MKWTERRRDPKTQARAKVMLKHGLRNYVIPSTTTDRALHFLRKRLKSEGLNPKNVVQVLIYHGTPVKKSKFEKPWK
jgi:hypothetical protein